MANNDLRSAIDSGDVDEVRRILAEEPQRARQDLEWRSGHHTHLSGPIGYVSIAHFHGLTDHDRMGEITRLLLDAGAPVDGEPDSRETPLITAASHGETDVARVLIDAGANLEATGFAVEGGTALAHAVYYGNPEVADLLLAAGAQAHTLADATGRSDFGDRLRQSPDPNDRAWALRAAAVGERLAVIDDILGAGTPIGTETESGTALHWAAFHGKPTAVRHLVEKGADATKADPEYGSTPLGWCQHRHEELCRPSPGHDEVERYLEDLWVKTVR
jgi:ankyrin repeat protein